MTSTPMMKKASGTHRPWLSLLVLSGVLSILAIAGLDSLQLTPQILVHAQDPGTPITDDLGPPPPPAKAQYTGDPAISFESMDHDWGTVLQGTAIEHTYKFRNTGTSILRITNVKPG